MKKAASRKDTASDTLVVWGQVTADEVTATADDHVVNHPDVHGPAGRNNLIGQLLILNGWLRIAAWMVVSHDHPAGLLQDCMANDLARIDRCLVHGAAGNDSLADQVVLVIDVKRNEMFNLFIAIRQHLHDNMLWVGQVGAGRLRCVQFGQQFSNTIHTHLLEVWGFRTKKGQTPKSLAMCRWLWWSITLCQVSADLERLAVVAELNQDTAVETVRIVPVPALQIVLVGWDAEKIADVKPPAAILEEAVVFVR